MAASSNEPSPEPTRSPASLQPHPEADAVPLMDEREYEAFRADIAAEGIHVPIEITREDLVLDGRQRLRAAIELGLMHVPVRVVAVGDELEYMLTAALLRRQLSPSQRAALVVELERYRARRAESKKQQLTMQDAITVHEHDRQLFERVKRGEVSAPLAARRVRRRLRDGALPRAGPMPGGLYEVICADPPWQMGNPDGPLAPEKHYPTMPLEEIKALEPRAADNSVLFLWAVTCLLPQALEVIAAWGFEHKSCLVWVKPSIGPGVWVRNRHELLLIATKGSFSPPDPEDRVDSVIEAPRGRHSEKPACVYELIERMYPHASKLELFARRRRPGWAVWGNEVPA